jgi:hypothetical protein
LIEHAQRFFLAGLPRELTSILGTRTSLGMRTHPSLRANAPEAAAHSHEATILEDCVNRR